MNQLNGPPPVLDDTFVGANSASGPLGVVTTTSAAGTTVSPVIIASTTLIDQFYNSARAAQADQSSARLLTAFNDGAAVMNARCQIFFRGLGIDARNLSYAQSQLTVITGGLTTILALISASQTAVAAVAAGSTALLTGMKQFGDAYYFSADVSAVEQLVVKAQREAMDKINQPGNGPVNFSAMISMLVSYQMICQPHTIKHLINSAVAAGNPVPEFQSPTVTQNVATVLVRLGEIVRTAALSPLDAAAIQILFESSTNTGSRAFRVACGYASAKNLVPADMFVAPPVLDADGNCPAGTNLSNMLPMTGMRTSYMQVFGNSYSVGQTYWTPFLQQVRNATSASALMGATPPAPPLAPPPGGGTEAGPPPGGTVNRGRVGGFSISIK